MSGFNDKEETPENKHDLTQFPYFELCKVRNMYFAIDIPVFASTKDQDVGTGFFRLKHIYCCN